MIAQLCQLIENLAKPPDRFYPRTTCTFCTLARPNPLVAVHAQLASLHWQGGHTVLIAFTAL